MVKKNRTIAIAGLLILLSASEMTHAVATRFIRVGRMWAKILDNGQFSETSGIHVNWYYTRREEFSQAVVRCSGTRFGAANWTDENGTIWPVKLAGAPYGTAGNIDNWFELPYPGEEDLTIKRVFRQKPPSITTNGLTYYYESYPLDGDVVDASQIPGTADIMTESYIRTWMGLEIRARSLAWSQKHHDDYVIYDWLITNTGNIDRDDDIELNQPIHDLYIMRQQEIFPNEGNEWSEYYGENMSDTSRIMFSTPVRMRDDPEDRYGIQRESIVAGEDPVYSLHANFVGEGTLFVPRAYNDPTDDPSQPRMHCVSGPDDLAFKHESGIRLVSDWLLVYTVMKEGYRAIIPCLSMNEAFPEADVYPNTAHDVEFPKRGMPYPEDFATWWFWHQVASSAAGPFELPIGESIRYVWAIVGGALKPEVAWQVYLDWEAGTCTWPAWEAGGENDLAELYPTFKDFPEVASTPNDQAKDRWVVTGRDSMLMNNYAAQWAVRNNYNVPIPPPTPSIEVLSLDNEIRISWGTESEAAADFAGYRVYRAIGSNTYHYYDGFELGKWEMIYEVTGTSVHSYSDTTARHGIANYYYVTAFDNGMQNGSDVYSPGGEVLESSDYINMTEYPVYPAIQTEGTLDDIRIVPNPYHKKGDGMYLPEDPNKILFINLPLECTIRIYTESLDLIKTIEHRGLHEDMWDFTTEEHQPYDFYDLAKSGLYIALFETPEGESVVKKFVIVR